MEARFSYRTIGLLLFRSWLSMDGYMYISQFNQIKLTHHKMSCDAHLFKQYQHFNSQNYIVVTPYRHSVWTVLNLWPLPKDTLYQVWLKIGPMATHGRRHISSFRKKWCSSLFEKNQNKLCQVEFSGKEDCFLNSSIYFSCFIIILLYIYILYISPERKVNIYSSTLCWYCKVQ